MTSVSSGDRSKPETMRHLRPPRIGLLTQLCDRTVLPGLAGFTNIGYRLRSLLAGASADSLAGRRIVITGATSGLGLAAARRLAALQAELVLVGRNERKLADVATSIEATQGVAPRTERADLSLMGDVRDLAARLLAGSAPIHVLINNAGALYDERELTAEGNERSFALNLLSPFLLTSLLIPRLVESAPARIVNVSSGGMYAQGLHVDDLQHERGAYDGTKAYARAKRGQVVLSRRWARDLAAKGVAVHAMHPGWADTPGVRESLPGFFKLMRPLLRTADEGADTIVWLAAAPGPGQTTGGFWLDRRPHPTHLLPGTRVSAADAQALWDALESMTG